ncbi:uncharacterized protein NPIL_321731 [Nephila pilipes]|uniref:Uncharacterized protein n=1 Tax=Nephila pilipes TaxID=299642 RepID=A0A8X6R2P7_NEPPI|nr:uncharacterized protein NPIL_321731 [Nephila pilipes]
MLEKPKRMCKRSVCRKDANLNNILNECRRNCKVNCRKLIFHYEIVDRSLASIPIGSPDLQVLSDQIKINIVIKNPEVIVMSHKPLYNAMDIFSYVGGLMGCWLGISVWTCTGIAETTFWTFLNFLKQYVMKSRHSPSAGNQSFFRRQHHNTLLSKYSIKGIRVAKKLLKQNPGII